MDTDDEVQPPHPGAQLTSERLEASTATEWSVAQAFLQA